MKIFLDLLTGVDNKTHDLGRWSWALSLLAVLFAGIWQMIKIGTVDLVQYASALGMVGGAHGVALLAKKDTEPKAPKVKEPSDVA